MTNKKTIIIFIVSFIIPLALAYMVLKLDLIPTKTVNTGEFLTQEIKLNSWTEINPKAWSIAYISPKQCNDICTKRRSEIKNVYLALGKNQGKVDLVLLGREKVVAIGFKNYIYNKEQLKQDALYLIDHMGLVVLTYPITNDEQANRMTNKGMIKDLKKLLNYARSS
ncbi:transmembrane cytochrome oxidase associated protein [Pseudoalteromonas sp. NBT06-2]|uniref:transmembrane cytochrome oxidase associated protein n=1 Tax=Pseudoalteromonas sp. NBT06-2 TaxID=2025950 RepID=UPI000BA52F31|nr:transmembrane cytochrome oxidase associated protein [Pseudoalteromonas sp. NBT06-2]PAJ73819.1 transmembrane cytochrome oxidase associated protein [Pseudoalteromonas sp. NBT06-2]